jgi:hypothetical protein
MHIYPLWQTIIQGKFYHWLTRGIEDRAHVCGRIVFKDSSMCRVVPHVSLFSFRHFFNFFPHTSSISLHCILQKSVAAFRLDVVDLSLFSVAFQLSGTSSLLRSQGTLTSYLPSGSFLTVLSKCSKTAASITFFLWLLQGSRLPKCPASTSSSKWLASVRRVVNTVAFVCYFSSIFPITTHPKWVCAAVSPQASHCMFPM